MTGWPVLIIVAIAVCGLGLAASGLSAYIRLVDPLRVDPATWIGDLTQGLIVLIATFALLGLGFASGERYAYVAAASSAGVEAVGIWAIWFIRRSREWPARGSRPSRGPALTSADAMADSAGAVKDARPIRILGISGSLRRHSYNRQLLINAADLLPGGVELELWTGLREVPPYNQDEDVVPPPRPVAQLRQAIADADALLIATPEYNGSIPGQLKNAIDWASRPVGTSALRTKPIAVVGASVGAFGAVWAQTELRKVLATSGARVVDAEASVARASDRFDQAGQITDADLRSELSKVLAALAREASRSERRAA